MKNQFAGISNTKYKKVSNLFSMDNYLRLLSIVIHFLMIYMAPAQANAAQDFIYNGFRGVDLHLDGIAEIRSNGLLRLTNDSNHQKGRAFHRIPLKFHANSSIEAESLSFSTIFVFAMVPELQNPGGHGMTFVISPSTDFSQATGSQYLGLLNPSNNGNSSNHIVAVEFDPARSPDLNDPQANHVGIDVNSMISNASASATYFSNKERNNITLNLIRGDPIQVWIDYDEVEKLLNVTLAPIHTPKPEQLLLSTPIDLSQVMLESMYVGFSAATGTLASSHYILGWSFNKTGKAQNLDVSKLPSLPPHKKEDNKPVLTIALLTVILVMMITFTIFTYIIRRKKYEEVREDWEREYGTHRFSFKNLYKATKGFKDKELLGAGGFGKVYKGVLPSSNVQIAVKRVSHDSKQGMKEFVAEIVSLGRLRHRNLVQLLGYCRRRGELLLVYDYMPKGSLDSLLFGNNIPVLSWSLRFGIIRGVASGLLYLHEEWEQLVLHRDIKASNVLLDSDWNGRLGDFGLARLYEHGANPQTTHVVGTVGYLAPELSKYGKATTCTDVFSFGAFMLEVACGRKPVELHRPQDEIILSECVIACLRRGAILDASDHRLEGNYEADEMELVLKLGLFCSHSSPEVRPSMRQVMQYLDGDAYLPEIPINSGGVSIFAPSSEVSDLVISIPTTAGIESVNSFSSDESLLNTGR